MALINTRGRTPSAETVTLPYLKEKYSGFVSLVRPLFFMLTPFNAAGAAVLAMGGYPSLVKCIAGFFAVALASCAVNIFNDYVDRERDKDIWPERALPSGRVKPSEALLVVTLSLATSLSIALLVFNPLTFSILTLAIILGGLYSVYLRDKVGYLSLPPIVGLIYLGGWAAFSPETLFANWLPWYLYLLGVIWQSAHIMVYYPLHIMPENSQRQLIKSPSVLFFKPLPRDAVKIGVGFTCLTLILSVMLFFVVPLGSVYLVLVAVAGVYATISSLKLLKNAADRRAGLRAFQSLSVFRLVISAAILLNVLLNWI